MIYYLIGVSKKKREKRSEIQRERKRERIDWGGVGVATFYPRFYSDLSRQQKKEEKKKQREKISSECRH